MFMPRQERFLGFKCLSRTVAFSRWLQLLTVGRSAQSSSLMREEAFSQDAMVGRFAYARIASTAVEHT